MRRLCRVIVLGAAVSFAATAGRAAAGLETYQMVRSLQLVQDRIANGDHAALPMQQKLLQMIDRRLREAKADEFEDQRNVEALLIYAMSGGNPITVDVAIAKVKPAEEVKPLTEGIRYYIRGDATTATTKLQPVDLRAIRSDLGSFVALIRGSMAATDEPAAALDFFDTARLLAPGTLVEEAALRRTLPLVAKLGDTERFLRASSQYVRRFLRSPYATQYADELVKGIVTLHAALDYDVIEQTIAEMTEEHQKVIYLRLARTAAIEGLKDLADFATRKAAAFGHGEEGDPRALLYTSLSEVTSDNAEEILKRLKAIDREALAGPDRQLLDAAVLVASEIFTAPDQAKAGEAAAVPPPIQETPSEALPAEPAIAEPTPPPPAQQEPRAPLATDVAAAPAAKSAEAPAESDPATSRPPVTPASMSPQEAESETLPVVSETRRKLMEIDKLLEESK